MSVYIFILFAILKTINGNLVPMKVITVSTVT